MLSVRLDADAVLRYLDPFGTDRRKHSAARESESEQDLRDAMKVLGISYDPPELDEEEVDFLPDPLAKALASLLVEKGILTAEEVQKAFDAALEDEP